MHASDDKQFPLASLKRAPQPKRAVSKKDFRLPRPYKRQLFSEEPARLTRLQVSLLGFAGVMVATLIAVLVLLADEKERSPHGKPIVVAAADLEAAKPMLAQRAAFPAAVVQNRSDVQAPLRQQAALAVPLTTALKAKPALRAVRRVRATPAAPVRQHAVAPVLPLDPDVALISAILLLTPPSPVPVSATPLSMELDGGAVSACVPLGAKEIACKQLHKTKP